MEQGSEARVTPFELAAYCDGELPGEEAARVEAALSADPALRVEMTRMMNERRALADAVRLSGDAEEADPAVAALADRLSERLERERIRRTRLQWAGAAAALGAIAAVGWIGHAALTGTPLVGPAPPAAEAVDVGVPGFVADAAGAHAIFSHDEVHPVEFRAVDEPVMREWFRSHLGEGATIPHLEALGFELMGGRLLGDAEGAMAQLLYENEKGDRVSLVFGRRQVPGGTELKLVHVGKSYASYWREGEFAWAVVEDSPGADVSAVATHVAQVIRATSP
jgi:anti-sigma factor RsiW